MTWLCVTRGGCELKFKNKPYRCKIMGTDANTFMWSDSSGEYKMLSRGSIKKLIGRELKWEDEAFELK